MAGVNENVVREFFELRGFFVRQEKKHVILGGRQEEKADFLVINPRPRKVTTPLPFVLESTDVERVERAIVLVKGWHTDIFSPARLTHAPQLVRFAQPAVRQQARQVFGDTEAALALLVLPALPQDQELRDQSIDMLRSKGVDAVIPFRTILADLIQRVEENRDYRNSDMLQILRILKTYEFLREPQLELFKRRRTKTPPSEPTGKETDAS